LALLWGFYLVDSKYHLGYNVYIHYKTKGHYMDWFNSRYSTSDLAEILSDYSKAVTGYRTRMAGVGRTTLVRELEDLDAVIAHRKSTPAGREQLRQDGWLVAEEYSPFETVNS
jgi:hypothetical protein